MSEVKKEVTKVFEIMQRSLEMNKNSDEDIKHIEDIKKIKEYLTKENKN